MFKKYGNKKVGRHDSKVESKFFYQLVDALPNCTIKEKEVIVLHDKFKYMGEAIRQSKIIPDFMIYYDGKLVAIVDTKGFQTEKSKLQIKLLKKLLKDKGTEIPIFLPRTAAERNQTINTLKHFTNETKRYHNPKGDGTRQ